MPTKQVLLLLSELLAEQAQRVAEMAAATPEEWLTPKEYAAKWDIDRQTVYRHLESGKIPGEKVGGSWRIPA